MGHLAHYLQAWYLVSFVFLLKTNAEGAPIPLGKSKLQAEHITSHIHPSFSSAQGVHHATKARSGGGFSLSELFRKYLPVIPNTYYDIPRHRYPYYDENGTGRLLYGYGGKTLYKYTVFKPLEGYFR